MSGDEMFERVLSRGDRRFDGYYIHFEATGSAEVDLILASVASAGKAHHSTEQWSDSDPWGLDPDSTEPSWTELIQEAANRAAAEIARLQGPAEATP